MLITSPDALLLFGSTIESMRGLAPTDANDTINARSLSFQVDPPPSDRSVWVIRCRLTQKAWHLPVGHPKGWVIRMIR